MAFRRHPFGQSSLRGLGAWWCGGGGQWAAWPAVRQSLAGGGGGGRKRLRGSAIQRTCSSISYFHDCYFFPSIRVFRLLMSLLRRGTFPTARTEEFGWRTNLKERTDMRNSKVSYTRSGLALTEGILLINI